MGAKAGDLVNVRPEFWSDFDGTIIKQESFSKEVIGFYKTSTHLPGYDKLLDGLMSTGVDIGGIVSSRINIALRRHMTRRFVAQMRLGSYFFPESMKHVNNDAAKAEHLHERSIGKTVIILDDNPYNVGSELVKGAHLLPRKCGQIILAAPGNEQSIAQIARLRDEYDQEVSDIGTPGGRLHTTVLPNYSFAAGVQLGELSLFCQESYT